jgi:hypothetical protein
MSPKFTLGDVVATPAALEAIEESNEQPSAYLDRHVQGDWGIVSAPDASLNDTALQDGTRIFSAYLLQSGVSIWIITEADRSATTVLLPDEY